MIRTIVFFMAIMTMAISGCSSENKETQVISTPPPGQVKSLSQADKDKIMAFKKELFDIEKLSKKALTLVGDEIKLVVKGEKDAVDVASLVDKAKNESRKSLDNLLKEAVPENFHHGSPRTWRKLKKVFSTAIRPKPSPLLQSKDSLTRKVPRLFWNISKRRPRQINCCRMPAASLILCWPRQACQLEKPTNPVKIRVNHANECFND